MLGFTFLSCRDKTPSDQIGLSLIADGVIEMTLITKQQVGFVAVCLDVRLNFTVTTRISVGGLVALETQSASLHHTRTFNNVI